MMKTRRRKRLIHKKIQGALAIQAVLHWLAFLTIAFAMLMIWQILMEDPYRPWSAHWSDFLSRYTPVFLVLLSIVPAIVYESVKLSHRLVGPIVRLKGAMQQVARGEHVRPIKLRKKDFGQEFIDAFNGILTQIQSDQVADESGSQSAVRDTSDMASNLPCSEPQTAKECGDSAEDLEPAEYAGS